MNDLKVRRSIPATAERLFEAWTQPKYLKKWWGPENAICHEAEIDLRVGGHYRIGNQFADGKIIWISGTFEEIVFPYKLVYSWRVEPNPSSQERVTVCFEPGEGQTEVIVLHERIETETILKAHEAGWHHCLVGLVEYLEPLNVS